MCQQRNAALCDHNIVFNSYAAETRQINARFHGDYHTRLHDFIAQLGQPRPFMNLHAKTVASAVAEMLTVTVTGDNVPRQCITFTSGHARFDMCQGM
ncbi:hypothetical protein D3C81_2164810 [compost metagenome]